MQLGLFCMNIVIDVNKLPLFVILFLMTVNILVYIYDLRKCGEATIYLI